MTVGNGAPVAENPTPVTAPTTTAVKTMIANQTPAW